MKSIKWLSTIILSFIVYSCGNKPYPQTVLTVDSIINTYPDSALTLLEQVKSNIGSEPPSTQIYYQLLTIKAKDKAYIPHTSDSLIKSVVKYYEDKKDNSHLPEAYYYAGRVYRDLGDAPQALDYFQKAAESIQEDSDRKLATLIYAQTGTLYLYQHIFDKALYTFKKAYHNTMIINDSIYMVYNLRDLGRVFTGMNNIDSTLYYYEKAEQVARSINNPYLTSIINQEVTNIYTQLKEYQKARNALQRSLCNPQKNLPPYYTVSADLYYYTGQIDSAEYYYKKLLTIGNYYQKQASYRALGKIAQQKGKYTDALNYMEQCLTYTDSIQRKKNAEAVQKVNSLYNYQLREKENSLLKETTQRQRTWILLLSSIVIIVLATSCFVITISKQKKKQKKMQAERQEEKLKEIAHEQYYKSQQYITENEKRIEVLKDKMQSTTNRRNELEKVLQETEKEVLELTNKQIKAKLKLQTLSEEVLKNSQIYKDFHHVAGMPNSENISEKTKITKKDWETLSNLIDQTYDNFSWRLQSLYPSISEQELRICLLLKISIPPTCIAALTAHTKQSISSSRKKLYEVTHNQSGKPSQWDDFIRQF